MDTTSKALILLFTFLLSLIGCVSKTSITETPGVITTVEVATTTAEPSPRNTASPTPTQNTLSPLPDTTLLFQSEQYLVDLAWSPDGIELATTDAHQGSIDIWNSQTGERT